MNVYVVGHADVMRLMPVGDCEPVMARVLRARGRGEAVSPLRQVTWLPEGLGAMAWMPADLTSEQVLGGKLLTVYPENARTPYESHQGAVLLFERVHGRLLAIVDASAVTAIRTAAVSAVATRALARPEAAIVTIVGTGTQARLHARAMCDVRPIREVRIWGRSAARARALCQRLARETGPETGTREPEASAPSWVVAGNLRDAVAGSDIVCTTTASREPILEGAWLPEGCHVNAVGAAVPGFREWDRAAIRRARVIVDARESALAEADEIRQMAGDEAGRMRYVAGELGEVLSGTVGGRSTAREITFFKSLGLAVEDVAAAAYVYDRLRHAPDGHRLQVDFAAEREAGVGGLPLDPVLPD